MAAGSGAGLVAQSDAGVEWSLLDREGARTRGPVLLNAGVPGEPRNPRVGYDSLRTQLLVTFMRIVPALA